MMCMNSSQSKTGDSDEDYWFHDQMKYWDNGCKFRHGQPTWYFSFMGRRDMMLKFQKDKRDRYLQVAMFL